MLYLNIMQQICDKNGLFEAIENKHGIFESHAISLWINPELSFEEKESSSLQKKLCIDLGFSVRELDSIQPNAFIAEYGSGSPTIGFLGEFDALPGLSQKIAGVRSPISNNAPGHGCGHNLLGTACLAASFAIKTAIKAGALTGRVQYFGCPAEEQLGKPTLARASLFNDVDAFLCWHPADINTVAAFNTNAAVQLEFEFNGKPSHSAQVPHLGRSALDSVTLMNVGTEFLREHMPQSARIHYIVSSGGKRPNIVPDFASAIYQIRGPHMRDVANLVARVLDVARGAALMTGTTMHYKFLNGCHDFTPNKVISELLYNNLKIVPLPSYTTEERNLAVLLFASNNEDQRRASLEMLGVDSPSASRLALATLHEGTGYWGEGWVIPSSTDVGDVSHIAPTGQILAAAWPIGVGTHTWQATASAGSGIGMKGMLYAAKVLSGAAWDLFVKPQNLQSARKEFDLVLGNAKYKSAEDLVDEAAKS